MHKNSNLNGPQTSRIEMSRKNSKKTTSGYSYKRRLSGYGSKIPGRNPPMIKQDILKSKRISRAHKKG